jgi:hypothetical protein
VYTPSELARLKQFTKDSKKPLYPDCQKYSRLFGDLKLLQLKANHGWSNKSFKHLLDVLRDMLPEGNQIAESVYEARSEGLSAPSVAMIGTRGKGWSR